VTDFAYNTGVHGWDPNYRLPQMRMRRNSALEHTPSSVLNFSDAAGGVFRIDYSTFAIFFRHNLWTTAPLLYVDNHTTMVKLNGPIADTYTLFCRGADSTIEYLDRPYFWW
jgi:hypothetical protein